MVSRRSERRSLAVLGGAIALTALIYAPARSHGTAYEDENWYRAARTGLQWSLPGAIASKPLASWSLVDVSPGVAHLQNIGLHLANGLLVYAIAVTLLTPIEAAVAAVIFLLAPLNSEAVLYLSARSDLLVTLCALTAVFWTLQPPSVAMLLMPLVASVVAVWCDQVGALVVPLVLLTVAQWRATSSLLRLHGAVVLAVGALLLLLALPQIRVEWGIAYTAEGANLPWTTFLVYQATALWHLLALVADPRWLSIDHEIVRLPSVWMIGAVVATVATLVGLAVSWQRSPITAWTLGWLVVSVAPHFLFRTNEWLSEHQLYLAMSGLSIGLAALVVSVHQHCDGWVAFVAATLRRRSLATP